MSRETMHYATEADWLAARKQDLTSTEAAALFDCSPYMTKFELYHVKTGALENTFEINDRMVWGTRLEAAIAQGIAEDHGLIVEPFKSYMRIPELRMGASFDFKIVGITPEFSGDETLRNLYREHGPGIMEVKNVDGLQFKRGWLYGDETEAPPHIELQIQHQLEVADLNWACGAALVGGNRPVVFPRMRDREIGGLIRAKVAEFWTLIDAGTPPAPDYTTDASTIARLYVNSNDNVVDLSFNNRLTELCAMYKSHGEAESAAKKAKDAVKAEITTIIGDAGKVLASGYSISAGTVAESWVEGFMRKSYRNIRITAKK